MLREQLVEMARDNIAHAKAGTMRMADGIMKIPSANYTDPGRFEEEVDKIFKRMPLMLAPTAELPNPGDYKSMEAVGVPILLVRGKDGVVRAFINSCQHRGTNVVTEETGNASRFVCPYHGWTYDREGKLVGVASSEDFGEIDKSCHRLPPLPTMERAGLIWAILDKDSTLDMEAFLCGYDELLEGFGFKDWILFGKRTIKGPNWKIAYDGYLDFYHLPVLHGDSFGRHLTNRAMFYEWGPHQRVTAPSAAFPVPDDKNMVLLQDKPEEEWDVETMLNGVWTIFPHISIASFYGGNRGVMVSQLFPAEAHGESITVQYYLMEEEPQDDVAKGATEQFDLLKLVVETEDYGTGIRQQKALDSGGLKEVMFGRNEGGGQVFHHWVQRILETDDGDLNALFVEPSRKVAAE